VTKRILSPILVTLALAGLLYGDKKPSRHSITVTFNYDFTTTPACSPSVIEKCIRQFNLYEISDGLFNRKKLASIPAPAGATGYVKGISGTTKPFLWFSGKHRIAIAAQLQNGEESDLSKCTIVVKIP
jgi:hypothetical protein